MTQLVSGKKEQDENVKKANAEIERLTKELEKKA